MVKPFFVIETPTQNITAAIKTHLIELRLHDRSGVYADSLELELADDGRTFPVPWEGKRLDAALGYENGPEQRRGHFIVDQVEHSGPPGVVRLSATAADFTSQARAPRERTHHNLTLGQLIEKLAGEHGYEAKVLPEALAQVPLKLVDQAGLSDLALAHQVAEQYGGMFKPVDGKWVVLGYELARAPVATLRPADVSSWRAHFIARAAYASVVAHYPDYDRAQRVPVTVGEGEPQKVLDLTYLDEASARAAAEAELVRARRATRRLTLTLPGRPDLASQQVITLAGFRERVDDEWLITSVTHTLNKRGYSCRVECEGV